MTKPRGTRNYNDGELHLLLAVMDDLLPLRKFQWDRVAAVYNTRKDATRQQRGATSLKRKFVALYSAARGRKERKLSSAEVIALALRRRIVERLSPQPQKMSQADRLGSSSGGNQSTTNARRDHPTTPSREENRAVLSGGAKPSATTQTTVAPSRRDINAIREAPHESDAGSRRKGGGVAMSQESLSCLTDDVGFDDDTSVPPEQPGGSTFSSAVSKTKPKPSEHTHCDVIGFFMLFERREEQHLALVREHHRQRQLADITKLRQRNTELCDADRRHKDLWIALRRSSVP